MAYGDFKDLTWRTTSNKLLRNKAFNIAKNPKHSRYQRGPTSIMYNFFDKKPLCLQTNLLPIVLLKMRIFQTKN